MTIVIAAGGTGGHVYPAVALAREFLRLEPETGVLFIGTYHDIAPHLADDISVEMFKDR